MGSRLQGPWQAVEPACLASETPARLVMALYALGLSSAIALPRVLQGGGGTRGPTHLQQGL